jgi:hypothetical protein
LTDRELRRADRTDSRPTVGDGAIDENQGRGNPLRNRVEAACAWAGITTLVFFGLALVVAGFIPPLSPALSADKVKELLLEHQLGVKLAGVFMLAALTGFMTLYTGISMQIRRMGGPNAQRLSLLQITLGGLSLVPVYSVALFWAAAAYRPVRSAEAIQLLSDMAWFNLVMPVTPALVQLFAIGFATLSDTRSDPIYPRWYGYAAFWVGLLLMAGLTVPFFFTGPLAWDGVVAFWMPASVLGAFVIVTAVLMLNAAKKP